MTPLEIIQSPIKEELKSFEAYFKEAIKSDIPFLQVIIRYILKTKGKQMRPMFVFLSAKMCGDFNETTHLAASSIELLHTASLVHDDVVDESYERRGNFSINALWKNKIAVLLGDFILARGMLNTLDYKEYRFLHLI